MPRTLFAVIICLTISGFFPWLSTAADELIECGPEPTDMTINIGDIIKCAITPVGDSDLFRFNGQPGEVIILTVTDRTTFRSRPVVEVFDPDNNVVASLSPDETGRSVQLLLSALGTYTVLVTESGNDDTNSYHIALQRIFPLPPETQTLCYGCTIADGTVSPVADSDIFIFSGTNGDTIRLTVTDRTTFRSRPVVQVFDPDNNVVASLSPDEGGDSVQLLLTELTYLVFVTESSNDDTNSYSLALQCITGPCLTVPVPTCDGLNATIIGTDGDNVITGTAGDDVIQGMAGKDAIDGHGGNDVICGGDGNDTIFAGDGDDIVLGNDGNDVIEGGPGNDELIGGAGHDVLSGGIGNDILLGGSGNDSLNGDEDDDELTGGIGSDVCDGGPHSMGDIAIESCDLTVDVP